MVLHSLKLHGQALVVAMQFLTRLPVPIQVPFEERVLTRSVIYFPIAGAVIGTVLYGLYSLLLFVPSLMAAVILLAVWIFLSGGLHLDGWMDTADGVLSHRSRERMLEIMKDSRVGAMGVIAAVLLMLFKFAALAELAALEPSLQQLVLLTVIPVWSRWWMSAAIALWPNARQGEGMGALFQQVTWIQVLCGLIVTSLLTWLGGVVAGLSAAECILMLLVSAAITIGAGSLAAIGLYRKLGGLTGDTYGALNEMVEAVLLFALLLVMNR